MSCSGWKSVAETGRKCCSLEGSAIAENELLWPEMSCYSREGSYGRKIVVFDGI
jgi:hypothetical protein